MKAPAFDYVKAASLDEALCLLETHGEAAKIIAGGQSLLPALNLRLMSPSILVDIGGLDDLRGISLANGMVHIGAMTRHADLLRSPKIKQRLPLLNAAIAHVAHAAIRNRGTIGGNLAHADPASELPACVMALSATIVVHGRAGARRIAASDFFKGLYETALLPTEILTSLEIQLPGPDEVFSFHELSRRTGDYAMAGIACQATRAGDRLSALKAVFFGVGDRPTLARQAVAELLRAPVSATTIAAAQAALANDLAPQNDLQASSETRLHLARVLLGRAVQDLTTSQSGKSA